MPWTDEMIEDLKKMWDEGLSTGEIGKRLGVSKNSIVGKVHRLKLSGRPSPIKKKDTSTHEKATKPVIKHEEKSSKVVVSKPVSPARPATPKAPTPKVEKVVKPSVTPTSLPSAAKPSIPNTRLQEKESESFLNVSIPTVSAPRKPGDKVTVTDLDNHTCRWPIGDPKDENFHFCGANVRVGQTYCEEHAAIAYVKNLKK
ncbi:MAG: GcrA cell cycle regulator [Alphaproteobacteria bacterium]|nr:GcrA cell cycle regulator [Alphaproteobacteria bacterium]